ncbi:hypothetical protein OH807_31170 [Kitasatospora sp. NBC_01560]|uniref:hypothetical protein n=1 Tax=Kitasatospora sp. NBC_01560 TaxID=2975965 RepID=UPI00386B93F4
MTLGHRFSAQRHHLGRSLTAVASLVTALLLTLACAPGAQAIVGGGPAQLLQHPCTVSIQRNGEFYCGGTLRTPPYAEPA